MEATNPTQPSQTPQPTGKDGRISAWVLWGSWGGLLAIAGGVALWFWWVDRHYERDMDEIRSRDRWV